MEWLPIKPSAMESLMGSPRRGFNFLTNERYSQNSRCRAKLYRREKPECIGHPGESWGLAAFWTKGFWKTGSGNWGLALAGKARGDWMLEGGSMRRGWRGAGDPKSISHEHTFREKIQRMGWVKLESHAGAALRKWWDGACGSKSYIARTISTEVALLRLFDDHASAGTLATVTQLDTEIYSEIRETCFQPELEARLRQCVCLACKPQTLKICRNRWTCWKATRNRNGRALFPPLTGLRDKYGDSAIFLAKTMGGSFRERVHENPAEKPEKKR